MSEFVIVPGHGKVRVGSNYSTTRPGVGRVTETASEQPRRSMYEERKSQVYATGNKWAIENFHATHD